MEELILFDSNGIPIEALLKLGSKEKGVVVTHPHPLYGGDMYNPVVKSIIDAYQKKDYSTLRLNFRGTGNSKGKFENGDGEQTDVLSAVQYMKNKGVKNLCVSGYSFGTWVNALAVQSCDDIDEMTMVSPPVAFIDFSSIHPAPSCITLVVSGGMDEIAPAAQIKAWLNTSKSKYDFEIINGADHFYSGYTSNLEAILARYI